MKNNERINGFDALRTIAMWLGIVLHSVIAYKTIPEPGWPQDAQLNLGFYDWLYEYIHIFRMPLFFLVAGFFARFVIMRSGLRYFIEQRFKRICIPFLLGILVIVPPTMLPFNFYKFHYLQQIPAPEAWQRAAVQMLHWNGIAHLWFLYYLIIFYVLALAIISVMKKSGLQLPASYAPDNISLLKIAVAILMLFVILYFFKSPVPPVYTGIKPLAFQILYYGIFFWFGWLIQTNVQSIHSLKRNAWLLFLAGTGISVFRYLYTGSPLIVELMLASAQTVAVVAGLTGLFLKYFHQENQVWRYCSDSAYWIYLVHMGVVAALQIWFMNSPLAPLLRFPIVLIISLTVSLLSYQYCVRYTVIGEYLHGKRKRREKNETPETKKNIAFSSKKF